MSGKKRLVLVWKQCRKYVLCVGTGVVFFLAAEFVDAQNATVENGKILRNDCGQGEAEYSFYVDGLEDDHEEAPEPVRILVPERKLTAEEFERLIPEMAERLCEEIIGENPSLSEVRSDLDLIKELPEYGVSVSWESQMPELVSDLGLVSKMGSEGGTTVYLTATLSAGNSKESVEIPVTVVPPEKTRRERFEELLQALVTETPEEEIVVLPTEFEGTALTYRGTGHSQNQVLLLLGIVAAVCLYYKERSDRDAAVRRREDSLVSDYPDLVSGFLILTGAGYPGKTAWKKLLSDYQESEKPEDHPLYEEMQVAVNQMETGMAETRAYAAFGRRCGLRCYIRFASLLESSVSTGSRNLRSLLEAEVDDAFRQRAAMARRKGEEASSKLLLPMFGMLAVVMVMAAAPAFLSLGN